MRNALVVPVELSKWENGAKPISPKHRYGSPETWIPSLEQVAGYNCLSFDYFVRWEERRMGHVVWQKTVGSRELLSSLYRNPSQIDDALDAERDRLVQLAQIWAPHDFRVEVIAFPEPGNVRYWKEREDSQPAAIWTTLDDRNQFVPANPWTMAELKEAIERRRGKKWRIGGKGLTYATSSLEKYLSSTLYMWPGDCDSLVVRDGKPVAVLEWKKHRLSDDIGDHSFDAYKGDSDRMKWQALGYLAQQLRVPLLGINWPTHDAHPVALIEVLDGKPDSLTSVNQVRIDLSTGTTNFRGEQPTLVSKIAELIEAR